MHITSTGFSELAQTLSTERKRQGLTRSQTAAVCNVSPSFIRDAESHPERCSLEKLVLLVNGLGLRLEISGLSEPPNNKAQRGSA
jgi:transcriptional regulator with XRE-family HTH domain